MINEKNIKLCKNIISLRYSLLPKYKGLKSIDKSSSSKDKYIGITLFGIKNIQIDNGKILLQKKIRNSFNKKLNQQKIFNLVVHSTKIFFNKMKYFFYKNNYNL